MKREILIARASVRSPVVFKTRPVAKAYGARGVYVETAYERARRLKRETTT